MFPKTKLVKANVEDFNNFATEHLAKPKNLSQTGALGDPTQIFGISKQGPKSDVAQCLRPCADFSSAYSDPNLGKTTKFGWRNSPMQGDEERTFGVPSIRDDIPRPKKESVTNPYNFGDEPNAIDLLFPHCFTHFGLSEEDVTRPREKMEIRDIFKAIGIEYKNGKFEGVWIRAQQIGNGTVGVKDFLQAVKEMHHIK